MAFLEAKDLNEVEEMFIVACKFAPNNAQERGFIQLTMAKEPTAVNIEAPTTNFKLLFPKKDDSLTAKIAMQNRISTILGSIVTIEKGISALSIGATIKEALATQDVKVRVEIKRNVGKNTDKEGNLMVFTELTKLEVLEALPKGEFEALIDFDCDAIPF